MKWKKTPKGMRYYNGEKYYYGFKEGNLAVQSPNITTVMKVKDFKAAKEIVEALERV